jgi:hypothetical protein
MVREFVALERRPSRVGARDPIGHPPGGHDDVAAVVSGLMSRVLGKKGPIRISPECLARFRQYDPRIDQRRAHYDLGAGLRSDVDPRAVDLYAAHNHFGR